MDLSEPGDITWDVPPHLMEKALKCFSHPQVLPGWCTPVWDGAVCWPTTPAGEMGYVPCIDYNEMLKAGLNYASMKCLENITWPLTANGSFAVNLSQCKTELKSLKIVMHHLPIIKSLSYYLYGLSIVALFFAIIILGSFSNLDCPRNNLHINLFASFLLRIISFILRSSVFEPTDLMLTSNSTAIQQLLTCKPLTLLWEYSYTANSFWITVEGFYISYIIYRNVHVIHDSIKGFVIAGWGLPAVIVGVWVTLKFNFEDEYCWAINNPVTDFNVVIQYSVTVFVATNFMFFCYMVFILCSKRRPSETVSNFMKSIAILIPLFAAHYLIFEIFQCTPKADDSSWMVIVLYLSRFSVSLQGFFVAFVLCFINSEVHQELRRYFRSLIPLSFRRQDDVPPRPGLLRFLPSFFSWPSRNSESQNTQDNYSEGLQLEELSFHRSNNGDSSEIQRLIPSRPLIFEHLERTTRTQPETCAHLPGVASTSRTGRPVTPAVHGWPFKFNKKQVPVDLQPIVSITNSKFGDDEEDYEESQMIKETAFVNLPRESQLIELPRTHQPAAILEVQQQEQHEQRLKRASTIA